MATDLSDVVKQGYLRCKSRSLGIWQKRWIVLRSTSNKGPCRLEKYIDEKGARSLDQHKVQLLTNVSAVIRLPSSSKRHGFSVEFNDGLCKLFCCGSDLETDNWVKSITQECFLPTSGIANGEPDVLRPGIQKELQEQFRVYLRASSKLEVFGECLLQVTHENIYLWDFANPKLKLCAWPLTALRRYGSDLTKFTFEAGRHCVTGEGMFIFHTLEGEKIYRKVHQATLAIAEAHQRIKKQSASLSNDCFLKDNYFISNSNTDSTFFASSLNFDDTNGHSDLTNGHISWYNSDNDSDVTASSPSDVYNHHSSRLTIDQPPQMFQISN